MPVEKAWRVVMNLDFSAPLVMAIVNCNGDSFYEHSRAISTESAVKKALQAESDGADIIDFGGESTRPGAEYVSEDEELSRVLPVVEGFRQRSCLPISVDTRKATVAQAVLRAGADIINDISAMEDDCDMARVCAVYGAYVVLMHKKGVPKTMQNTSFGGESFYEDVVSEVVAYLRTAAERVKAEGVAGDRVILDPGIGFGKSAEDNIALIRELARIRAVGYPILIGLSRKSVIGRITGRDVAHRLAGTLAANAISIGLGANIIRVHDTREHIDLIKVFKSCARAER
ncbi:MAG: dihydropteroate synthase [Treponema sp.]|jgi:dihydropteroate synthase|nr:dihydropteroate synthase [Treponema sp.]